MFGIGKIKTLEIENEKLRKDVEFWHETTVNYSKQVGELMVKQEALINEISSLREKLTQTEEMYKSLTRRTNGTGSSKHRK